MLAIVAASLFAISVGAGRWWTLGEITVGPFAAKNCFGGECRASGLDWLGDGRWSRFGIATWAAGLLSALALVAVAAAAASKRSPRLLAKFALMCVATATAAAIGYIALYPGIPGATIDRGLYMFVGAVVLGIAAGVLLYRTRLSPDPEPPTAPPP